MGSNERDRLIAEVASWPGVVLGAGRFASTRFLVGRRELGHLHGATTLDMPLPKSLKADLIARGEASEHRYAPPHSGWVTVELADARDFERALKLLRERYEHAVSLQASRAAG